jgi:hypothetical protein
VAEVVRPASATVTATFPASKGDHAALRAVNTPTAPSQRAALITNRRRGERRISRRSRSLGSRSSRSQRSTGRIARVPHIRPMTLAPIT